MKNLGKLVLAIGICELTGLVSTPFTLSAIPGWYASLQKPPFSPPNWVFGPVWTILYFLMGVSAYLVWQKGLEKPEVRKALAVFFLQLFLNFLWSLIFFGARQPFLAFLEIAVLWLAIAATIFQFFRISKMSAYLLLPYIAWVSFAALLNFSVAVLNR